MIRSIIVATVALASLMFATQDDYVTVIVETDSQISDIVSIDLDDSRVARAIFTMNDIANDEYDDVALTIINSRTRLIQSHDLARVCSELRATDVECFA